MISCQAMEARQSTVNCDEMFEQRSGQLYRLQLRSADIVSSIGVLYFPYATSYTSHSLRIDSRNASDFAEVAHLEASALYCQVASFRLPGMLRADCYPVIPTGFWTRKISSMRYISHVRRTDQHIGWAVL